MNKRHSCNDTDLERLEALYQALPEMEKKSARLLRSRAAAEAATLYNKYNSFNSELELLIIEAKSKHADDHGFVASMIPAREKAVLEAKKAFEKCLCENGFGSLCDAKAVMLSPEDNSALSAEIDEYKKEYAALLDKCGAVPESCQ
ncbi:MAG: hypothetical protein EOM54_04720 [Clostridia bacterium]|nr:hypothetical protein [Clostridia bacterium]